MDETPEKYTPNGNENANGINIVPPFADLPYINVTEEAERLGKKFNNSEFHGFYCKAIYWLGFERIHLIEARVSDSKFAAKLFTKIANEEIKAARQRQITETRKQMLDDLKDIYGEV